MKKVCVVLLFMSLLNFVSAAKINGFITDEKNGERIPYATVLVKGTTKGSQTNQEGYFLLKNLYDGEYVIKVQQIGYQSKEINIAIDDINSSIFKEISLVPKAVEIEGTEVIGKRDKLDLDLDSRIVSVSKIRQSTNELKEISYIAEADVFRAIQTLPGVTPISDFSSGLYVRGGSSDQNLILLDGVDVYNPNHFGGLFSTFNTDAIQNVELMKGGFSAKYGGRLSSVLELNNLDGNRKEIEGISRVSLITASTTVQSPWKIHGQSGSMMGSFRRTYLDLVAMSFDLPDYYFYDGHFKFNWDLPNNDKMVTSFYYGKDKLSFDMGESINIEWGNETLSQRWIHIFTPSLFSHFIFAGSHYGSIIATGSNSQSTFERLNDIYDISFKADFSYEPNDEHLLDFGYDCKYNKILFDVNLENSNLSETQFPDLDVDAFTNNIYLQDSWKIWGLFTLQPGIRLTHYFSMASNLPESQDANYFRIAPRLSAKYRLSFYSNLNFSYGRYHQYLTSVNTGISTPFDVWFPLDGEMKPGSSDHFILGYQTQFNDYFTFEVEGYLKTYDNLVEFRPEGEAEWNNNTSTISDLYNNGKGFSFGSDILIKNSWNGLEGFVGYGIGTTKRKIKNININPNNNQEEYFYPQYDRTHQINIVESFNLTQNLGWELWGGEMKVASTFNYSTGQPYQTPEKIYFDGEDFQILYSYKDRARLPDYIRLDLSLKTKWYYSKWNFEPYLQIINLTNHENVWTKDFAIVLDEEGKFTIEEYESTQFPFLPFIGFNFEW